MAPAGAFASGNHFQRFRAALTPTGRYLSLYMTPRLLLEMAITALGQGQRARRCAGLRVLDGLRTTIDQAPGRDKPAHRSDRLF